MQQKLCPTDGTPLMEMIKNGVTIDVCPECKGVWLDRGELEKLINVALEMEREYGTPAPARPQQPPQYDQAMQPGPMQPGAQRGYDQAPPRAPYSDPRGYGEYDRDRGYRSTKDSDEWYEGHDPRYPKKKKSALGRIFDIFD
jgi:hypothetical protein